MKSLVKSNGTLFPAIPSLFDDFFNREWLDSSRENWRAPGATLPAVNVMETNDDFRIEVAAPGCRRPRHRRGGAPEISRRANHFPDPAAGEGAGLSLSGKAVLNAGPGGGAGLGLRGGLSRRRHRRENEIPFAYPR